MTVAGCSCGPGQSCAYCWNRPFYQWPTYQPLTPQPWVCPKCSSIYGPAAQECWRCNPPAQFTVTCVSKSGG